MITEKRILKALRENRFIFHYQPKASLVSGKIVGAEALIRWISDEGIVILPWEFIPLAEKSELISKITNHMFSRLVNDIQFLQTAGGEAMLPISFNASARDLEDRNLVRQVVSILEKNVIKPEAIEIELTETEALSGGDELMKNLSLLRDTGIALTMDDYGTGYSSIDSLSKWPFSTIKLDQGIISRMLESSKNAKIVQSSIRMGHELNINVVAEGVETKEQCKFLIEAGCKTAQGYLISKPLALSQLTAFQSNALWPSLPTGLIHMAMIDHIQWRRQIVRHVLACAQLPADSPKRLNVNCPELSYRDCSLGKWYFDEGKHFSGNMVFRALDVPHRELHDIGSALIEKINEGASLNDIAPLLHDLTECSKILLGLLESLEDQGIAEMHRMH